MDCYLDETFTVYSTADVTVTPDFRFEVSRRIKEEFENGRDYYALNGKAVAVPDRIDFKSDRTALLWHNTERFRG